MRSTDTPRSTSFSAIQSTAVLLCAQTSTCGSRCNVSYMASTSVVVFPVPGGPWTMATSLAQSTRLTADSCVALSQGRRTGYSSRQPVRCVPSRMSLSSASRLPLARATSASASNIVR